MINYTEFIVAAQERDELTNSVYLDKAFKRFSTMGKIKKESINQCLNNNFHNSKISAFNEEVKKEFRTDINFEGEISLPEFKKLVRKVSS